MILIFTEGEGDGIESRLPFKFFLLYPPFCPPSPPPLGLLVCRPMQKQHFWKMHFRVKNPVGQENQFLRSGFFIRWKCGAILLKGCLFFRRGQLYEIIFERAFLFLRLRVP